MKTLHSDLFPETLLVMIRDGHTETDSLKVAEHFHKRHKNIIQSIEILITEVEKLGGDRLNFQPISYRDAMNREQKMYRMDRLAFSVLANRFTGTKALAWQIDYHKAFEQMERQITAPKELAQKALFTMRPAWPVILDHPDMRRGDLIGLTGHKSEDSITACRRRMRQVGLLPSAALGGARGGTAP